MSNEASELIVEQIQIGPMANFTYIVGSRSTREVVVVDPAWEIDGLLEHLAERDYTLTAALATHYHPDHVGGGMGGHNIAGVSELLAKNPVKVYAHRDEAPGVRRVTGISESDLVKVDSGDKLSVGPVEIEFLHTPGHTPGHVSVHIASRGEEAVITGDAIHHPCQIAHPDWSTRADSDQAWAADTRSAFLDRHADTPVLVIGTHFAGPTAGRLVRDGTSYRLDL